MKSHPELRTLCLFVGHPRSGHTVVGALLDAHPDVVIAQKLDVLRLALGHCSPGALTGAILTSSRAAARTGRAASGYHYEVPGQWQGRHRTLRVIGDKAAGHTTQRLARRAPTLADLKRRVPLRLLLVHVVRDPFDNISTLVRRGSFASVAHAIAFYDSLCTTVAAVEEEAQGVAALHRLYLEDLIAQPHEQLRASTAALGVEAPAGWLEACSGLLWPQPSKTRELVAWTPEQLAEIEGVVDRHPWLRRYEDSRRRSCAWDS